MGNFYSFQMNDAQTSTEREATAGRRYPIFWTDANGNERRLSKIESPEQLHTLMQTEEYANDAVMRASVQDLLANSKGVPGVWSNEPEANKGQVNYLEAARKEALRESAARMHKKLGSSDPVEKWEALKWISDPANQEAVSQAEEVYGAPASHAINQELMANKGFNRIQHTSGSVTVTPGLSEEHQALVAELSAKQATGGGGQS